jgi:hypothetical protein
MRRADSPGISQIVNPIEPFLAFHILLVVNAGGG